jgi:phosphoglycolate phosphatase-like HAD superfamily hydrolase
MEIQCVLWDFGNTLADQDWLMKAPKGYPLWPQAWNAAARGENESPRFTNEIGCDQVAEQVSALLGMPYPRVMAHIRDCCCNIDFFDSVLETASNCPLPQAIVTLNPDVFSRYVIPAYQLDQVFPVIVTSWEEQTVDKSALCALALERLGGELDIAHALLVDNLESNVRQWREAGGAGYLFRGTGSFSQDLESLLSTLRQPANSGIQAK